MKRLVVVLALFGAAYAKEAATPIPAPTDVSDHIAPDNAIVVAPSVEGTPIRFPAPLDSTYVLRTDRELTLARTVRAGEPLLTGTLAYAQTARLAEDVEVRRRRGEISTLPAGLGFYRVNDIPPRDGSSALAIGARTVSAWCTPERSWEDGAGLRGAGATCIVQSDYLLFGRSNHADIVAAGGHPLAPTLFDLDAALHAYPILEEAPLNLSGEMYAEIQFQGVRGRNLAARMTVRMHMQGYADVVREIRRESPIMPDGSAYFSFGPQSTLQLEPTADASTYAVRVSGRFEEWLSERVRE
ncbi:MAG: hypothetical protein H7124_05755 [Phycisphaerales bacterium]|nr:hypothetical protein [Hyphomonadaceae bacterium]